MEIQTLLQRFANVRNAGDDQWSARCPGHEDNRNSLCISATSDGTLLMKCQAGCKTPDIMAAIGGTMGDLFPSFNGNGHAAHPSNGTKSEIVAAYDYRDEAGELVFQVVRREPKDFRQRRPAPDGGWINNVSGCRVLPFHLQELLALPSELVFIPEGEKDVQSLLRIGLHGTCNAGGAGKWKAEHAKFFAGRDVVILPDNDPPGRSHGQQVARSLVGIAKSIRLIDLPNLPDKGDASDWIQSGGTREQLLALVEAASEWKPESVPETLPEQTADKHAGTVETFDYLSAAEFDSTEYETSYHIDQFIPVIEPTVIAAQLKTMKSTVAEAIAWSIATGDQLFGKFSVSNAARVLHANAESGPGAVQDAYRRIARSYGRQLSDATGLTICQRVPRLNSPAHVRGLEKAITETESTVCVLDPLYFMLSGDDAGNLMKQGALLRDLNEMMQGIGCTAIIVHHAKKQLSNPGGPLELTDISWAGIGEWARSWVLLSRREPYQGGSGLHKLWMSYGGSSGHSGMLGLNVDEGISPNRHWRVDALHPDEVQESAHDAKTVAKDKQRQQNIDRDKLAIVTAARKLPKHQGTLSDIRARSGRNGQAFSIAFSELINAGDLVPTTITKGNNREYEGYQLREESE